MLIDCAQRRARTTAPGEVITTTIAPNPVRQFGVVMQMGPVTAIQETDPPAKAGIKPGDLLTKVDGQAIADPMRLSDVLCVKAGHPVTFTIERKGESKPLELVVDLREPLTYEWPVGGG